MDHLAALILVDLHHRLEQLGMRAVDRGHVGQRLDVLGEAAAAVADAGIQEVTADALVVAHAHGHLLDVGAQAARRCWRSR